MISINTDRFRNPHDETLARVVLYGGRRPRLWFNWATEQNLRWGNPELAKQQSFAAFFPGGAEQGITLPIPVDGLAAALSVCGVR